MKQVLESNLDVLNTSNIISGRRTRGKKIDYSKYDDSDDDEEEDDEEPAEEDEDDD